MNSVDALDEDDTHAYSFERVIEIREIPFSATPHQRQSGIQMQQPLEENFSSDDSSDEWPEACADRRECEQTITIAIKGEDENTTQSPLPPAALYGDVLYEAARDGKDETRKRPVEHSRLFADIDDDVLHTHSDRVSVGDPDPRPFVTVVDSKPSEPADRVNDPDGDVLADLYDYPPAPTIKNDVTAVTSELKKKAAAVLRDKTFRECAESLDSILALYQT